MRRQVMKKHASLLILVTLTLALYVAIDFGGIRSADNLVVYMSASKLTLTGKLTATELTNWPHFGVAIGKDGETYSIDHHKDHQDEDKLVAKSIAYLKKLLRELNAADAPHPTPP